MRLWQRAVLVLVLMHQAMLLAMQVSARVPRDYTSGTARRQPFKAAATLSQAFVKLVREVRIIQFSLGRQGARLVLGPVCQAKPRTFVFAEQVLPSPELWLASEHGVRIKDIAARWRRFHRSRGTVEL